MNAAALRKQLRDAGWPDAARNLPSFIASAGLPCWRTDRADRIRIELTQAGTLIARLVAMGGELVRVTDLMTANEFGIIADEESVHLYRHTLPSPKQEPSTDPMTTTSFRLPRSLKRRAERWLDGGELAPLLRRLLDAHLTSRGA